MADLWLSDVMVLVRGKVESKSTIFQEAVMRFSIAIASYNPGLVSILQSNLYSHCVLWYNII